VLRRERRSNAKECIHNFLLKAERTYHECNCYSKQVASNSYESTENNKCKFDVKRNFVSQSPQYTIAALRDGVYIIGTKDQFNIHDLKLNSMEKRVQYVMDEMGFVLFDVTEGKEIDKFGPYFIEQYIIMDVLSKQEVAQNVLEYYCENKAIIQRGLAGYTEKQGKGFVCWRFLINETAKAMAVTKNANSGIDLSDNNNANNDEIESVPSGSKRRRSDSTGSDTDVAMS